MVDKSITERLADLSSRIDDTLAAAATGCVDLKARRERQKARAAKAFAHAGGNDRSWGFGKHAARPKSTISGPFRGSEPDECDGDECDTPDKKVDDKLDEKTDTNKTSESKESSPKKKKSKKACNLSEDDIKFISNVLGV